MRLRDWDPGIFGLTWIRLDLYHYDTSEAMGSIKGEWHLGIFGKAQEIEEIRVVMVAQRIWILPRSGVEIGNSVNHLSDLGGMSTTNSQTIFFSYHSVDWNINTRDCFGKVLEIGIWLGSVEEILEIMVILFQIFIKMVTRGFGIVLILEIIWSRYGINGFDRENIFCWSGFGYKRRWTLFCCFIVSTCLTYNYIIFTLRLLVLFSMTQGQLVGKGEDTKNGEMARKRLKISVPHLITRT